MSVLETHRHILELTQNHKATSRTISCGEYFAVQKVMSPFSGILAGVIYGTSCCLMATITFMFLF